MSETHRAAIVGMWSTIAAARGETITLARGVETAAFVAVPSRAERREDDEAIPMVDDSERLNWSFPVATLEGINTALWPVERSDRITDPRGNVWEAQSLEGATPYRFKDHGRQIVEVGTILVEQGT